MSEPLSDAFGYGTLAARSAARIVGRLYYATDTSALYRDNGTSWDTLSLGAALTVREVDGTPSDSAVTVIEFPNGTLTIVGHTATFAPAGGGANGPVLLEQHTASSSASLDFTSFISSDYDEYGIEIVGLIPASNNVPLWLRFSTDGGSTWQTTTYYWSHSNTQIGGTGVGSNGQSNVGAILMWGDSSNNGAASGGLPGVSMSARLFQPQSASNYKIVKGEGVASYQPNSGYYQFSMGGMWLSATAINALQFKFSSGNISSGTIRVYGIRK